MLLYEQCIIINILSKSVYDKHFYIFFCRRVYMRRIKNVEGKFVSKSSVDVLSFFFMSGIKNKNALSKFIG